MIMPLFSGESPILPPALNYVLSTLMREAIAHKSRKSDDDRVAFDIHRSLAFRLLHEHFERQTHNRALQIIKEAWDRRAQFGLYLRNFSLGSVNSEPVPTQEDDDPYDILTNTNFADLRLQLAIAKHISSWLPVIGIENPAYDPRHKNTLPKLSLNNESWRGVASSLIGAAEIIIIYYDQSSLGVNVELDMIRSLGRQRSTLVVRPSGRLLISLDEVNTIRQRAFAALHYQTPNFDQSNASRGGEELADFPITVSWDESGYAIRRLKKVIANIQRWRGHFSEACPMPLAPQFPENLKQWAGNSIMAHKLLARSEAENGNLANSEDHLTACLVVSFLTDSPDIRASTFLGLAYIQWSQGKLSYAIENLERALDLFERLPSMDYSSLSEISSALQQYRKQYRIRAILKRISTLQDDLSIRVSSR
jgi:tetratricopeptide (TPR) repeat protein